MKHLVLAAAVISLLVTNSWATTNYNSSKSNIYKEFPNATLTTASVNDSGPSDTQVVYTTPTKGDFLLTMFCASPEPNGGVRLDAAGLGGIAQTVLDTSCYTFTPGVSVPRDSAVTCSTASGASPGSYFCTISGMQTAK